MNSPTMAMKWLRGPLGICCKNGIGLGAAMSSLSFEACEDDLLGLFRELKRPGRNPAFAWMFSIVRSRQVRPAAIGFQFGGTGTGTGLSRRCPDGYRLSILRPTELLVLLCWHWAAYSAETKRKKDLINQQYHQERVRRRTHEREKTGEEGESGSGAEYGTNGGRGMQARQGFRLSKSDMSGSSTSPESSAWSAVFTIIAG